MRVHLTFLGMLGAGLVAGCGSTTASLGSGGDAADASGSGDDGFVAASDALASSDGGALFGDVATGDGATTADAGALSPDASLASFCGSSGSLVGVGSGCTGAIAATTFRWAICTCQAYTTDRALTTDAFDSSKGPYSPGSATLGGAVGFDDKFQTTGTVSVGGSMWESAATGLGLQSTSSVAGELRCGGALSTGSSPLSVGADAYVAGNIESNGDLTVTGKLHQPSGATLHVAGTQKLGGTVSEPVSVSPPCDCSASLKLPVASWVTSFATTNDDAALGVDPRALENVTTPYEATLGCGRYYFTRIGGTAPITLHLTGRTAIFIGGDVSDTAALTFDVQAPAGEVDVFLGGNLVVGGGLTLGSAAAPSKARLWGAGTGTLDLGAATTLAGNLYAPDAQLVTRADAVIFGSVFVRGINTAGDLTVHYDTAILGGASSCPPPPPSTGCGSCRDCDNQACVGGTCGACTDSSQCCAPLTCQSGVCRPAIH